MFSKIGRNSFLKIRVCSLIAAFVAPLAMADEAKGNRPRLQIINGSKEAIDVVWLKSPTERVPNGVVPAGEDFVFTTTIGHQFALVGRDSKTTVKVTSEVRVQGFRYDPPSANGTPAFYTQSASANGFPIVASAKVNPYALKEAVFLANMMLANRPDVRDAMIKSGARMCIMAHDEYTTDLPEFQRLAMHQNQDFPQLPAKEFWDARARGLGGSELDPYCSVAEENVLALDGDPYEAECILIHEFAHNIHLRGMLNVDPTFDDRLQKTYESAMKAGLWKGKYAAVNRHEYFAEGVQSWFDNNRVNDHDHNHVDTRQELQEYDPGLASMCREVFGSTELKYTKPTTRLRDHMQGYDPKAAPKFVWPEKLAQAKNLIRQAAKDRDAKANGGIQRETRDISGWKVHINRVLLEKERDDTEKAMGLLKIMLDEIIRDLPKAAVDQMKQVPFYVNPAYRENSSGAEFHPGADWLRENGRDPVMVECIEFSGVADFEKEVKRMPNFALHELAHAYHFRFLPKGYGNEEILAAYAKAKASGKYERVERSRGDGSPNTFEPAYGISNAMEYFAETTEAYFTRNDFFPFNRAELQSHDPEMLQLLEKLWGVSAAKK